MGRLGPWAVQAGIFLIALSPGGCSTGSARQSAPSMPVPASFVADIGDGEWAQAIPMEGDPRFKEPALRSGPKLPDPKAVPLNTEQTVSLDIVIRADGTVGVYRVVHATDLGFLEEVLRFHRARVYEPTLLDGKPVAIRREVKDTMRRIREVR